MTDIGFDVQKLCISLAYIYVAKKLGKFWFCYVILKDPSKLLKLLFEESQFNMQKEDAIFRSIMFHVPEIISIKQGMGHSKKLHKRLQNEEMHHSSEIFRCIFNWVRWYCKSAFLMNFFRRKESERQRKVLIPVDTCGRKTHSSQLRTSLFCSISELYSLLSACNWSWQESKFFQCLFAFFSLDKVH